MGKTIFIANRWVKFILNGEICIGITYLLNEIDPEEPLFQMVLAITQRRNIKTIIFRECLELRYLEFITKPNFKSELLKKKQALALSIFTDLVISPIMAGQNNNALAQNQFNRSLKN